METRMKQFERAYESEIQSIEDSLMTMRDEFANYRANYERAYAKVRLLMVQRESGFSTSSDGEPQEQRMMEAIQVYCSLRIQIDWWLERVRNIIARISEIERLAIGEIEVFVDE